MTHTSCDINIGSSLSLVLVICMQLVVTYSLQSYKGKHGDYIDQLEELDIPPYLFTRKCVEIPTISLNQTAGLFTISVRSRALKKSVGHIRQDRYVKFDN